MKQGSRSLLVMRNWTAPSCLCSAQGWMSKQIQGRTFYQPFFVHIHFYPACFKTVVPEWSNFCTDNAHWRNQIQLIKINCCSQMYTKWNLIVYIWDVYSLNNKFARRTFDLAHLSCLFVVLFNKKWNVVILYRCETKCRSTKTLSWFKVDNESWEAAPPSVKWWGQTALLRLLLHFYYRNWGLVETWAETSMQSMFWW